MRDAIIVSGWTWNTFNSPERLALAFAQLGCRVLYCENPVSRLKNRAAALEEIQPGIYRAIPRLVGHRLNRLPLLPAIQAKLLASEIQAHARSLHLRDPFAMIVHGGGFLPLAREFKQNGIPIVHVCMDYPEQDQEEYIRISELTLVIPKSVFHPYKAKYGEKVFLIPQVTAMVPDSPSSHRKAADCPELAGMPRPRIGYIGQVKDRLNLRLVREILNARPEWHFVHCGAAKALPLPNVHTLSWQSPERLPSIISGLNVGFTPYDCSDRKNFHCVPLKVFDYFAQGLPVVSTPIVNLWEYDDVIYFGDDAEELSRAIQSALDEPATSPKRAQRMAIAREHTIHDLAKSLAPILGLPLSADAPLVKEARV